MKRLLFICLLAALIILPASSQTLTEFEGGFEAFAAAAADSLPFNALIGQHWSDSYIGKFPHLGVGLTLGATTIPFSAATPVLEMMSITLPGELAFLEDYGMPIPAYTADVRLGLPLLPMDIGVKAGYLPEEAKTLLPADMSLDYLLVGADVRLGLIEETTVLPAVSVGAGYNFLQGKIALSGLLGGSQEITNVDGHTVALSDPNLAFNWQTNVIDIKAQISKSLLILVPYAGFGASLGTSSAGGGMEAEVLFDGAAITQADIDLINAALGEDAPDLSETGILVSSQAHGWAMRAYAGVSLKLGPLFTDLMGMYNLTSQAYGASLNLRVQF